MTPYMRQHADVPRGCDVVGCGIIGATTLSAMVSSAIEPVVCRRMCMTTTCTILSGARAFRISI